MTQYYYINQIPRPQNSSYLQTRTMNFSKLETLTLNAIRPKSSFDVDVDKLISKLANTTNNN